MKAMKSLLAASVLIAAGAANAAIVQNYTVSESPLSPATYNGLDSNGDPVSYNLAISGSGTGTATLSDTGVLTITLSGSQTLDISAVVGQPAGSVASQTTTGSVISFNTTGAGPYFLNKTGSTTTVTSCVNGPLDGVGSCASVALNTPAGIFGANTYYSTQSFTLAGGTLNVRSNTAGATVTQAYTLTAAAPAVPVPAAAWLFGSGLLGLAGTARRRRAA